MNAFSLSVFPTICATILTVPAPAIFGYLPNRLSSDYSLPVAMSSYGLSIISFLSARLFMDNTLPFVPLHSGSGCDARISETMIVPHQQET
jgi:hypothetical protein